MLTDDDRSDPERDDDTRPSRDPRIRPWFWTWDGHSSIPTSAFVWTLTLLGALALGMVMSWNG
jgi:hypothetical protein